MLHQQKEDVWFFPGGKLDKGEDTTMALQREVQEEVGANVTIKSEIGAIKILFK